MGALVKNLIVSTTFLLLVGCGSDSNIFSYTTNEQEKEAFDALVMAGQAAYDRNDLETALDFATKAYEQNPRSERAALLFGYVNLSLAKADPFSLATSLANIENEESDPPTAEELSEQQAASLQEEGAEESAAEEGEEEDSGTGETLDKLKGALGLTTEDILALGDLDESDPEIPVLIPKCVEEARAQVKTLEYVDAAIAAICPFVNEDIRNTDDVRQECDLTESERKFPYKSHFLWAFAHLTEALAFYSVLTYGSADPEGKKSNLQLKMEKLQTLEVTDPTQIQSFIETVNGLEHTINQVLPVGGTCSLDYPTTQLVQTLNDMLAVNAAFEQIPTIPDDVKGSIVEATEKITNLQNANASDDKQVAQTKALKGDLTKKLAGPLSDKLDTLQETTGQELSAEETTELCASFESISAGGADPPALCAEDSL